MNSDILSTLENHKKELSRGNNNKPNVKHGLWLKRTYDEIKKVGKIVVEFKVEKKIIDGLKNRKYMRKGGVIVDSSSKRVVKWLEEAKVVSKTTKALNLTAIAIDVFAEYVLNEKLKAIEKKLENIEEITMAEHWHSFLDGKSSLSAALNVYNNDAHKKQLFYDSRKSFESAKNKNLILLNKKIEKVYELYTIFSSCKITNIDEALEILEAIKDIYPILFIITQCYRSLAKVYESLQDYSNSSYMRKESLNIQMYVYDSLYPFIKDPKIEEEKKDLYDLIAKAEDTTFYKVCQKADITNVIYSKIFGKEIPLIIREPEIYFAKKGAGRNVDKILNAKENLIHEHDRLNNELVFLTIESYSHEPTAKAIPRWSLKKAVNGIFR